MKRSVMLKIKSLSFAELTEVKAKVNAEIELRDAKERARLIVAIASLGRRAKGTADSARPHAFKGKKLPPLYRNPKNRSETWAGRGNKPRWLVAGLKSGKKLKAFAIK
jgi:DNA-binding protein H-NS